MAEILHAIEKVTDESAAARGAVIGAVIGFFVIGGFAIVIAMNAGTSVISALGIGLFAAFWGGPGFGGMLGGTLGIIRHGEAASSVRSGDG